MYTYEIINYNDVYNIILYKLTIGNECNFEACFMLDKKDDPHDMSFHEEYIRCISSGEEYAECIKRNLSQERVDLKISENSGEMKVMMSIDNFKEINVDLLEFIISNLRNKFLEKTNKKIALYCYIDLIYSDDPELIVDCKKFNSLENYIKYTFSKLGYDFISENKHSLVFENLNKI